MLLNKDYVTEKYVIVMSINETEYALTEKAPYVRKLILK